MTIDQEDLFDGFMEGHRARWSGEGLAVDGIRKKLFPTLEPYWRRLTEVSYLGYQKTLHTGYHPEYWWAKIQTTDRLNYFRLGVYDSFQAARRAAEEQLEKFFKGGDPFDEVVDSSFSSIFFSAKQDTAERYARQLGTHGRVAKASDIWIVVRGNFLSESNVSRDLTEFEKFSTDFYKSGSKLLSIHGTHFLFDSRVRCSSSRHIPLFSVRFKTQRVFSASQIKQMTEEQALFHITNDKNAMSHAEFVYASTPRVQHNDMELEVKRLLDEESEVNSEYSWNSSVLHRHANEVRASINHPQRDLIPVTYEKLVRQHFFNLSHEKESYMGVFPPYKLGDAEAESTGFQKRPSAWRYNFDRGSVETCSCGAKVNARNFRCALCLGEICYRCGACVNAYGNKDIPLSNTLSG